MDSIRFQIQISRASHPALFELLHEAGAYHRGRRLLALASTAMSGGTVEVLESTRTKEQVGSITANTQPKESKKANSKMQTEDAETNTVGVAAIIGTETDADSQSNEADVENTHYKISADATEALGDMLGMF